MVRLVPQTSQYIDFTAQFKLSSLVVQDPLLVYLLDRNELSCHLMHGDAYSTIAAPAYDFAELVHICKRRRYLAILYAEA